MSQIQLMFVEQTKYLRSRDSHVIAQNDNSSCNLLPIITFPQPFMETLKIFEFTHRFIAEILIP